MGADIKPTDWMRILVGEVPASFFVELFIRALVIYLILIISIRIMGKRMSSQLSRNELAALVSLAAAVGIPMMAPDRGLLPGIVVAFVLVTTERLIARQSCKSQKFESIAIGDVSTLISDGVIDMKELTKTSLSHERILSQLRSFGVLHLGTVTRLYMESGGSFSLVKNPSPIPGLSVLPPWDNDMRDCFTEHADKQVCVQCGFPQNHVAQTYVQCPNCGSIKWVTAVTEADGAAHLSD